MKPVNVTKHGWRIMSRSTNSDAVCLKQVGSHFLVMENDNTEVNFGSDCKPAVPIGLEMFQRQKPTVPNGAIRVKQWGIMFCTVYIHRELFSLPCSLCVFVLSVRGNHSNWQAVVVFQSSSRCMPGHDVLLSITECEPTNQIITPSVKTMLPVLQLHLPLADRRCLTR